MSFRRFIAFWIVVSFFLTTLGPLPKAHADTILNLPAPGTMVNLSPAYEPVMIKGLTVHKDNPFLFDFIVDVGQDRMSGEPLKKEGEKLIKYFLASLAIPDKDVWVNLSPYEKNKMIPEALGQTDMGRDLLEQDYILKQITASLIYPEKQLGKKFWDKVYSKAQQMYGTTQVPVNTFNKVWIMADRAEVFEHNQTAFVVDSHLKVMLEEDYLALQKHAPVLPSTNRNETASIGANIVRTIILPEIEREVNTGKNFANLRQILNSLILANWYRKNLKEALLNQVYTDQSMVKGIDLNDPTVKQQIYDQYLKAYKKGVFNYIKEDVTTQGDSIPRKYFSGGFDEAQAVIDPAVTSDVRKLDFAMGPANGEGRIRDIEAGFDMNRQLAAAPYGKDAAMRSKEVKTSELINVLRSPDAGKTSEYIRTHYGENKAFSWLRTVKRGINPNDDPMLVAGLISAMAEFSRKEYDVDEAREFVDEIATNENYQNFANVQKAIQEAYVILDAKKTHLMDQEAFGSRRFDFAMAGTVRYKRYNETQQEEIDKALQLIHVQKQYIKHPDIDIVLVGKENSAFKVPSYVLAVIKDFLSPNELAEKFNTLPENLTVVDITSGVTYGPQGKIVPYFSDQLSLIAFPNDEERDRFMAAVSNDVPITAGEAGEESADSTNANPSMTSQEQDIISRVRESLLDELGVKNKNADVKKRVLLNKFLSKNTWFETPTFLSPTFDLSDNDIRIALAAAKVAVRFDLWGLSQNGVEYALGKRGEGTNPANAIKGGLRQDMKDYQYGDGNDEELTNAVKIIASGLAGSGLSLPAIVRRSQDIISEAGFLYSNMWSSPAMLSLDERRSLVGRLDGWDLRKVRARKAAVVLLMERNIRQLGSINSKVSANHVPNIEANLRQLELDKESLTDADDILTEMGELKTTQIQSPDAIWKAIARTFPLNIGENFSSDEISAISGYQRGETDLFGLIESLRSKFQDLPDAAKLKFFINGVTLLTDYSIPFAQSWDILKKNYLDSKRSGNEQAQDLISSIAPVLEEKVILNNKAIARYLVNEMGLNAGDVIRPGDNAMSSSQRTKFNILLLAPVHEDRKHFTDMLTNAGYTVKKAYTVAQAEQMLGAGKIDFVLSASTVDIKNGMDLIKYIANNSSNVPIALISPTGINESRELYKKWYDPIVPENFVGVFKPDAEKEQLISFLDGRLIRKSTDTAMRSGAVKGIAAALLLLGITVQQPAQAQSHFRVQSSAVPLQQLQETRNGYDRITGDRQAIIRVQVRYRMSVSHLFFLLNEKHYGNVELKTAGGSRYVMSNGKIDEKLGLDKVFLNEFSPFVLTIDIEQLDRVFDNVNSITPPKKPKQISPGGIDLNTSGMNWKINKDGKGVEMNIDPAMIERIKHEGIDSLSPVIFRITPVASIWPLVGLQAPAQAERLAAV